jgi:hypothetical protein
MVEDVQEGERLRLEHAQQRVQQLVVLRAKRGATEKRVRGLQDRLHYPGLRPEAWRAFDT